MLEWIIRQSHLNLNFNPLQQTKKCSLQFLENINLRLSNPDKIKTNMLPNLRLSNPDKIKTNLLP